MEEEEKERDATDQTLMTEINMSGCLKDKEENLGNMRQATNRKKKQGHLYDIINRIKKADKISYIQKAQLLDSELDLLEAELAEQDNLKSQKRREEKMQQMKLIQRQIIGVTEQEEEKKDNPYEETDSSQFKEEPAALDNELIGHIPCLFLPHDDGATKIIIYFHGNAEDIGLAFELLYMLG